MIENEIPANIMTENKRHVSLKSMVKPSNVNPFEFDNEGIDDKGGMYCEEFGPHTVVKEPTEIYNDKEMGFGKERVTTRASTAYKASPL